MFITKTEYFYGFTAGSDPNITIDHLKSSFIEGEMASKRHGAVEEGEDDVNVKINIKFTPESVGEVEAYLCVMFPKEKSFSKFYKITAKGT